MYIQSFTKDSILKERKLQEFKNLIINKIFQEIN
jgi:hypothetical protein